MVRAWKTPGRRIRQSAPPRLSFGTSMSDSTLRRNVLDAIRAGRLPPRRPDRIWGGPGGGAGCRICGKTIGCDELEVELEIDAPDAARPQDHAHVHLGCFQAWERELRSLAHGLSSAVGTSTIRTDERGTRDEGECA
jgi:hypothetical protein